MAITSDVMVEARDATRVRSMPPVTTREHTVGDLIREWRGRRRMSQLELSNLASVSTRHLSFVENGRSAPTRGMVATLADHLEVPLRAKNQLFLAAGFAPPHAERDVDDHDLAPVLDGLRRLLDAHLPWPALLLDDHWDVVDSNSAVDALLVGCAPELLEPPVNAIRITLDPRGLAPRVRNLTEWGGHLVAQLLHRAEETQDPRLGALLTEAESWLGAIRPEPPRSGPVVTMEIVQGEHLLRLFSVSARLEMATDLTLDGLHLETFVPADAATADCFSSTTAPHG